MPHEHFQGFGVLEWTLTLTAALASAWCIWLAVRYTLRPGESDPGHIKRLILDEPRRPSAVAPVLPPTPPARRG